MGSLPIVFVYPCSSQLSDLGQALKDVGVQDLLSIRAVETLHVAAYRLAWRCSTVRSPTITKVMAGISEIQRIAVSAGCRPISLATANSPFKISPVFSGKKFPGYAHPPPTGCR